MDEEKFAGRSESDVFESLIKQQKAEKDYAESMHAKFVRDYRKGNCVLCGKPFKTKNKDNPCLHWLLRQCKFRTKDFPAVYKKYGYLNISSYLRQVANEEVKFVNINDLNHLKSKRNLFEYTVRWKNIEWTFHCTEADFSGHEEDKAPYKRKQPPHYHFQMRVDERQFINFNSFHVPFNSEDIFKINLVRNEPDKYFIDYFNTGAGMQAALEIDPEDIITNTRASMNEDEDKKAIYNVLTQISGGDKGIDMKVFFDMCEEKERTGESTASLVKKYFPNDSTSIIRGSDNIRPIAKRTENKSR